MVASERIRGLNTMPRVYVSNESYPEMREIEPRWHRHVVWWRAFRSAVRDWRFWWFIIVQLLQWTMWWLVYQGIMRVHRPAGLEADLIGLAVLTAAIAVHAFLTVTWGGDVMRSHLRNVSTIARESCPSCGHRLTDQLRHDPEHVFCQECGETTHRRTFEPPYPIPRRFRAMRWPARRTELDHVSSAPEKDSSLGR